MFIVTFHSCVCSGSLVGEFFAFQRKGARSIPGLGQDLSLFVHLQIKFIYQKNIAALLVNRISLNISKIRVVPSQWPAWCTVVYLHPSGETRRQQWGFIWIELLL